MTTIGSLKAGTRVRLGEEMATVVTVTPSRVRVRLDRVRTRDYTVRDQRTGIDRKIHRETVIEKDVAPSAEVEVI